MTQRPHVILEKMGKDDAREAALRARRLAVQEAARRAGVSEPGPKKRKVELDRVRDADSEVAEKLAEPRPTAGLEKRMGRVVSVLREIAGMEFKEIDQILGLPAGESKKVATKKLGGYEEHTQRHIDACVSRFYRNKITILDHLIHAAPISIKMWRDILQNPAESRTAQTTAAKEIREWTSLFLRTKSSSATRSLFSKDLQEKATQADQMETTLQAMLGSALDGAPEN